jgi:hypothetical protein
MKLEYIFPQKLILHPSPTVWATARHEPGALSESYFYHQLCAHLWLDRKFILSRSDFWELTPPVHPKNICLKTPFPLFVFFFYLLPLYGHQKWRKNGEIPGTKKKNYSLYLATRYPDLATRSLRRKLVPY